jgi:hypothetical protein
MLQFYDGHSFSKREVKASLAGAETSPAKTSELRSKQSANCDSILIASVCAGTFYTDEIC